METHSNNIFIGSVAVFIIVVGFAFVIWIGQIQLSREFTTYDMYFEGSVSGLSVASDVRYNGISVGDVKDIELNTDDPNLVRVRIEVIASAPVKVDTVGSMSFLGVTGISFIELTGGSASSAVLLAKEGEPYAVINVQRSAIQELMETAPNILAQSNMLLLQGAKLLSDENVANFTNTLDNLNKVMASIAGREAEIGQLIVHAAETAKHLDEMSGDLRALVDNANGLMAGDVPEMVSQILAAAESIDKFGSEANALIEENSASLNQFSTQGLGELSSLLAEARLTVATLERLAAEFEEDPTILLGQNKYPEYEAN